MALLKVTCKSCKHQFFRIMVQCNKEGVDLTCPTPECGEKDGDVEVVKTDDGSNPFAGCTHL
ncbi:MAG: hypothetical protein ACK4NC_05050 [Candidatus Gracilibacteria bacterium]